MAVQVVFILQFPDSFSGKCVRVIDATEVLSDSTAPPKTTSRTAEIFNQKNTAHRLSLNLLMTSTCVIIEQKPVEFVLGNTSKIK